MLIPVSGYYSLPCSMRRTRMEWRVIDEVICDVDTNRWPLFLPCSTRRTRMEWRVIDEVICNVDTNQWLMFLALQYAPYTDGVKNNRLGDMWYQWPPFMPCSMRCTQMKWRVINGVICDVSGYCSLPCSMKKQICHNPFPRPASHIFFKVLIFLTG